MLVGAAAGVEKVGGSGVGVAGRVGHRRRLVVDVPGAGAAARLPAHHKLRPACCAVPHLRRPSEPCTVDGTAAGTDAAAAVGAIAADY